MPAGGAIERTIFPNSDICSSSAGATRITSTSPSLSLIGPLVTLGSKKTRTASIPLLSKASHNVPAIPHASSVTMMLLPSRSKGSDLDHSHCSTSIWYRFDCMLTCFVSISR